MFYIFQPIERSKSPTQRRLLTPGRGDVIPPECSSVPSKTPKLPYSQSK